MGMYDITVLHFITENTKIKLSLINRNVTNIELSLPARVKNQIEAILQEKIVPNNGIHGIINEERIAIFGEWEVIREKQK